MEKNNVWVVVTKSRPLPGCEIDMDGCEFYFSDALVPLESDAGAAAMVLVVNAVKEALLEDKLELADVLVCAQFKPEEWIDQTDAIESLHELATKSIKDQKVEFSGFRSEEIQALYHYKHLVQEITE